MPIARFQFPDGRIGRFEVPEGTTPEQAQMMISGNIQQRAQPPQEESIGRTIVDQSLQGGLFGTGDELTDALGAAGAALYENPIGFAKSIIKGDTPEVSPELNEEIRVVRKSSQDRLKRQFKQHPVTSLGANIGGAILTASAAGSTAPGAAASNWLRAGTTGARAAKGALAGAVSGGLYGAGASEEGTRLKGAGQGAVFGGVAGGAVPYVEAAVRKYGGGAIRDITNWVTKKAANASGEIPDEQLSPAMQKVYDRLKADIPDDAELLKTLNSYASKKGKALVEAGGRRTANLAEGSFMYPTGGAKAGEFFDDAADVATTEFRKKIGGISSSTNYLDDVTQLLDKGREKAAPIYSQAFKANKSVHSPVIDKILETPAGKQALKDAVEEIQNEMAKVAVPDKEITAIARELKKLGLMDNVPSEGVAKGLSLRTLDEVKKALGRLETAAYQSSDQHALASAGRYTNLRQALTRELDSLDSTGLYAKARAVSGEYLSSRDAMKAGLDFFKDDIEVIRHNWKVLDTAGREAYKAGIKKSLVTRLDNVTDGHNVARLIKRPVMRDKLMSVLSPKEYSKIAEQADITNKIFQLKNQITGNSRTYIRKIAAEEFDDAAHEFLSEAAEKGIAQTSMNKAYQFIRTKFDGLSDRLAGEVADILYETDPKRKYQIVKQLVNQANMGDMLAASDAAKKLNAFYGVSDMIADVKVNPLVSGASAGLLGAEKKSNGKQIDIRRNIVPSTPPPVTQAPDMGPQSGLFNRVLQQESEGQHFNKDGTVKLGKPTKYGRAVGIAQVLPSTGKEAAKLAGLPWSPERLYKDPAYNAALGEAYLNHQMKRYNGNTVLALMAYNWGQGNVDNWLKNGAKESKIPVETINYVKKILKEG